MNVEEYFQELYITTQEELKVRMKWLAEGKGNKVRIIKTIRLFTNTLGIVEVCYKGEYLIAKQYFYQSSKAQEWFYEEYIKKEYEIEEYEVTTYIYETLYSAILSGSKEQRERMAKLFGSYAEEEKNDFLANVLLGYSLKYIILDDKDNAMKYIEQLEDKKSKAGMKQLAEGHARAFRGLIEGNEEEFNKGLEFMLKHHVARMKRDGRKLEQYFAFDSVALAMLAKERGINITVKHELLPEEYLEETDIDYSAIEVFL